MHSSRAGLSRVRDPIRSTSDRFTEQGVKQGPGSFCWDKDYTRLSLRLQALCYGAFLCQVSQEILAAVRESFVLDSKSRIVYELPPDRVIIKKVDTVNQADASNTLTQRIVSLAQKFESFQDPDSSKKLGYPDPLTPIENSQSFQKQPVQGPPEFQSKSRATKFQTISTSRPISAKASSSPFKS
ncbi:hypothetical protein RND71_018536 [Anisodus tanguticus]|uniref:Uncharacterized protein n=1 Tax=Anisodus tanguticus TaxID=243964 RepID=A0AAE1VKB4_9SOLA|nr:hypothetical protein RND71_018536 [Anisodus tanguticus]